MKGSGTWPDIVIAGSGFGGIAMAVALKKAGIDGFTIVERAADVGGVWRDNIYPGAACDVPSRLYSYSFAQDFEWSDGFAPQGEILAYLKQCAERYGVLPHIRFNTEIAAATFNDRSGRWGLETTAGEHIQADIFISAVGLFNTPKIPDIEGRDRFRGTQFHSACWDHGCDLAGKRVAVIGTGASAIQFVPEIAPVVDRLHVFQRTPQYVLAKEKRSSAPEERSWFQRHPLGREIERLRIFLRFESGTRRRSSDEMTRKGEQAFLAHLARQVPDPALRARLTPDYRLGCKRVLRSNDWYPALQRPNVELVDTPIAALHPGDIETADGERRPVDAIIYGTGFTPTNYLSPMRIRGAGGRDLNDAWRDGAEAYFGVTVAGFPNLFMLYGPNTNLSGSIVYMLESQARYIVRCLRALRRRGAKTMDVRAPAQRRFNEGVQRRIGTTVLAEENCHTYFKTDAGRITTQWPGFQLEYRARTWRVRRRDYDFGLPATSPAT